MITDMKIPELSLVEDKPVVQSVQKFESSNLRESAENFADIVQPEKPTLDEIEDTVVQFSQMAQNLQRSLLFSIDEKSGDTFLTVKDSETEEVIREIPSREIREIKAKIGDSIGLLFSDKG